MVLQPKLVSPLLPVFPLVLKPLSLTSKKQQFNQVLHDRRKAFFGPNCQLGKCELYEVKIQLKEGAKPFRTKPYRLAPHIQKEAQK